MEHDTWSRWVVGLIFYSLYKFEKVFLEGAEEFALQRSLKCCELAFSSDYERNAP